MATIRIIEQPSEKTFRFRYESENRRNMSIAGATSTTVNPTYPTIEISNHTGVVHIIVSCVYHTLPYK